MLVYYIQASINKWEIVVSIKRILAKAWEDCRKEGVELDRVSFEFQERIGARSVLQNIDFSGLAIEKPQNQPDE